MPLTPEIQAKLAPLLAGYRNSVDQFNQAAADQGEAPITPLPVQDFEINSSQPNSVGAGLLGGPLGSLASLTADTISPGSGRTGLQGKTLGLAEQSLGNSFRGVGADKLETPAIRQATPTPGDIGQNAASILPGAASNLTQFAALNAVAPGSGWVPGIVAGAAQGALSTAVPSIQQGIQATQDSGSVPKGVITAAVGIGKEAGKGALFQTLFQAGLGATGKAVTAFPAVKSMVENIAKDSGWKAADQALNMTLRGANALAGGSMAAIQNALEGVKGGDAWANLIFGAGLPSILHGDVSAKAVGEQTKPAIVGGKPTTETTNTMAAGVDAFRGRVQSEIQAGANAAADKTGMKTFATPDEIKAQNDAFLKSSGILQDDLSNQLDNTALKAVNAQRELNTTDNVNPVNNIRALRVLEDVSRTMGDEMLATNYATQAQEMERRLGVYDKLATLHADVQEQEKNVAALQARGVQGEGFSMAKEDTTGFGQSKADIIQKYLASELKFNKALVDVYGNRAEQLKPTILREMEAQDKANTSPVAAALDQVQAQLASIKGQSGRGTLASPLDVKPIVPGEPARVALIPKANLNGMAQDDVVSSQVHPAVVDDYNKSGAADALQKAIVAEWMPRSTDPNNPLGRAKGDQLLSDQKFSMIQKLVRGLQVSTGGWDMGKEVFRKIAEMFPGAEQNPLYGWTKNDLENGTVKAAMIKSEAFGKLVAALQAAGMKLNTSDKTYSKAQGIRLMYYIESAGGLDKSIMKGKMPFSAQEKATFSQAEPLIRNMFDTYLNKLNSVNAALGKPQVDRVTNYLPWLEEYNVLNSSGVGTDLYTPDNRTLSYEHERGNVAPEKRTPLMQAIEKYMYDVDLKVNQAEVLHTVNAMVDGLQKAAVEREMPGSNQSSPDLTRSPQDYTDAANYLHRIAENITGTKGTSDFEKWVPIKILMKLTDSWAGQVIATPTTMMSQVLGFVPMVAETGLVNAVKGVSASLERSFWRELHATVLTPELLADPARDSSTFRARMMGDSHRLMIGDSGNIGNATIGKFIGRPLAHMAQMVDLFMTGAAYRAGYAQAIEAGMTHAQAISRGDYVASSTQAVYEKALRPLFLQTGAARLIAPLSTSSFTNFNSLKDAAVRDYRGLKGGKLQGNTNFAAAVAVSVLLRWAIDNVKPTPGNPIEDAIFDQIPVIGSISRFGTPGPLGAIKNAYGAKSINDFAKSLLPVSGAPQGSLQLLNTAQMMAALYRSGSVNDKNGREIYRINTDSIPNVLRGLAFGPGKTNEGAAHIAQYAPDLITRINSTMKRIYDNA